MTYSRTPTRPLHVYQSLGPFFIACVFILCAPQCSRSEDSAEDATGWRPMVFVLDKAQAEHDLTELTKAAHPFGSLEQQQMAAYLMRRIGESHPSLKPVEDVFEAAVPNRSLIDYPNRPAEKTIIKGGRNVFVNATKHLRPGSSVGAPCMILLGSHFDTKILPNDIYVGANDSGSSTAALLQIIAQLAHMTTADAQHLECDIGGIFFDGEEAVLDGWHDGLTKHPAKIIDNTYGSRHMAAELKSCPRGENKNNSDLCLGDAFGGQRLKAVLILDMIGSLGISLTIDANTDPELFEMALDGDQKGQLYPEPIMDLSVRSAIEDDHIPFYQRGIATMNFIDFNHLEHWHKPSDLKQHISYESMERAARLMLYTGMRAAQASGVKR